jgi:RNA-directed DNA polymerase
MHGSSGERTARCRHGGSTSQSRTGDSVRSRSPLWRTRSSNERRRRWRGAHDALDALCVGIDHTKVNWILDADIRSFFDEVGQEWAIRFLKHRIGDPRIIRLIQKWLKAGVLEDGVVTVSDKGTGQGSVISPLLANIYLHYVLDLWTERWRRREATGDMIIVRYADDIIVGFQHETDARRFLDAMRDRLKEFSLSLHPEKTRLIEFGRDAAANRKRLGLGKPETFNLLGFTFMCGNTRQGKFQIKRKTRRDRMRAKLEETKGNCDGGCTSQFLSEGNGSRKSSWATSGTMQRRPTVARSRPSVFKSPSCGGARYGGAARRIERLGFGSRS